MLGSSHLVAVPALESPGATPDVPRSRGREREEAVARRHIAAYNRRDLQALRALSHPDIELDWSASSWVGAGTYRGIDAVVRFHAEYYDAFEQIIIEAGPMAVTGDTVLVPNVARLRGRDGIEVLARSTLAFTVRGGKVAGIRLCQ